LSSLALEAPATEGFGVDFALVSWGGSDPHLEDLWDDAGLRGLRPPMGSADDLSWYGAATNFGDGVRTRGSAGAPSTPVPGEGWEARVDWSVLFPELGGAVPVGAAIGVAAILVDDEGSYASNQALPPFPAGAPNPGRSTVPLPAVVRFVVDADLDGVGDGQLTPSITP
jgi:hypothetical protein